MRPPSSRTLSELLCEQAAHFPDRPAVICRGGQWTYAEFAERAKALGAGLHAHGVRHGTRVGLFVNNRVEFLEVLFGASARGAVVVPFSTWSTRSELEFLLRDSGVSVLFTLDRLGDRDVAGDVQALLGDKCAPELKQIVVIDGEPRGDWIAYADLFAPAQGPAHAPGTNASASDPLVILYTSGSSNRPKAVPLQHGAAIGNGFNIGERQGLGGEDRVFLPVPLFWSYAVINALPAAMTHGATLVIQERFEPEEALALIEDHDCTAIYTLPAITNALLGCAGFHRERTRSLRTGLTIGSPQDVIRAANELGARSICNIYGSTETCGNACVTPHDWPVERRAHCQGPPLPGVSIRIRDQDSGNECAVGTVGSVEVRGYLTVGYEGDSARFNVDVFTGDGYFRTGDLASLDSDGCLVFAGRSSEMIKRSGINVSPAEIEEVIQQHPAVGLAGVTGTPDERLGEAIVAFIVRRPGTTLGVEALLAHCKTHLSSYKIPDRVEFIETLPLTPTGKVMRRELGAMASV